MADKQMLQQFRSRVMNQSVLRSGLYGLLIGACTAFVAAFVSWFFGYDGGLWLSIGLLVGVTVISGVILYFTKFRVTNSLLARRIDMLGLDERIVTMMELENEDSFIAKRQREDASAKLKTVSPKQLKFRMAKKSIISIVASVVVASAMMVVGMVAPSGLEILYPNADALPEIEIVYEVEEGGSIDGEELQLIFAGEDAAPVMAIADEGWIFVGWDDGQLDPYRHDTGLTESKTFVAIFEEIEEDSEQDGEGEGEGEGAGAGDMPGEGQGGGKGQGNGNGNGEGESEGDGQGEGAGGKHAPSNVVIDGQKDYGDVLDIDTVMDSLANGEGSGSDLGNIIDSYFGALNP